MWGIGRGEAECLHLVYRLLAGRDLGEDALETLSSHVGCYGRMYDEDRVVVKKMGRLVVEARGLNGKHREHQF